MTTKLLLFASGCLLSGAMVFGQDSIPKQNLILKTNFEHLDKQYTSHVYLVDLNDTAALFMKTQVVFRRKPQNANASSIPYSQIETMAIHRKGSVVRGTIVGAIIGAVAGGIIGASVVTCQDCNTDNMRLTGAAAVGVLGGAAGAFIGFLVGVSPTKTFTIGGKKKNFDKARKYVLDRAYR